MGDLVTQLFSGFSTTITALSGGIKTAFEYFLYVDPEATTRVVSDIAKFVLTFSGISIAIGLVYMIVRLVRNH